MTSPQVLVVQNDPTDDARRLGTWLADAGADLVTVRPFAGDALPASLDGLDGLDGRSGPDDGSDGPRVAGLVVLGGAQRAWDAPDGTPDAPWFPSLRGLLRAAVAARVPTLGVCLGGQLLADATGGRVAPSPAGPECGAFLVARRDVAARDPLFAAIPFTPDVYQWHRDEVVALPPGAVQLAASARVPHQAFRVGERAWGLQFHIECDLEMLAGWAADDAALLAASGWDADALLARCAAVLDDVEEVWRPFAGRFVALAAGRYGGLPLPVVEA